MKFKIIKEYHFKFYDLKGYLSDFSQFNHKIDKIKLHEETIPKNEISSGTDIDNFEPIVLSLYPEDFIDSHTEIFETKQLILLDGHHRLAALLLCNYKPDKCFKNKQNLNISCYQINLPIKKIIKLANNFDQVKYKSFGEK